MDFLNSPGDFSRITAHTVFQPQICGVTVYFLLFLVSIFHFWPPNKKTKVNKSLGGGAEISRGIWTPSLNSTSQLLNSGGEFNNWLVEFNNWLVEFNKSVVEFFPFAKGKLPLLKEASQRKRPLGREACFTTGSLLLQRNLSLQLDSAFTKGKLLK